MRKATIVCSDFEPIIDYTGAGDFLFLDPPYRPSARDIIESHYVGRRFGFSDQVRLARALSRATSRGVKWAMTNSSHPDIVRLLKRSISITLPRGTGSLPGIITSNQGEVLIRNYSRI